MLVKDAIKKVNGLPYVIEHVQVCSSWGKSLLLNQPFMTDDAAIERNLDNLQRHIAFLERHPQPAHQLVVLLHEINDITKTLQNLKQLQVLDDIELFEIKKFSLASQKIAELLRETQYECMELDDLSKVVELLDPEGSRIAHFYVYSCYHPELEEARKKILQSEEESEREKLTWEVSQMEDSVRQKLTEMLQPYREALLRNLHRLGDLDVLNAKAQMAAEWHLTRPATATERTAYTAIFHPQIVATLAERGGHFQPVDIALEQGPCLITGANMSGKTVLLKSLALAQHMFQFGFYVPAERAEIVPVEEVICLIDDQQTEQHGLSSFAAEMLSVNEILLQAKRGVKLLALVDELARTTNPDEGRRIVNAFVRMMQKYHVMSIVTTHYSGIPAPCRRLRVKGLTTDKISGEVTPHSLNRYMDYRLTETTSDEVPAEALTIARIFHVDDEFLALAKEE